MSETSNTLSTTLLFTLSDGLEQVGGKCGTSQTFYALNSLSSIGVSLLKINVLIPIEAGIADSISSLISNKNIHFKRLAD